MPNNRFTLRRAVVDDSQALGALHVRVWRDTYSPWMNPSFLQSLNGVEWAAEWQQLLYEDCGVCTVVAIDSASDDEIIGFASAGPVRDRDAVAETELYVLNTDVRCHGMGIAGRLLESVLPTGPATLWVVEQNKRAQAFYRKHRFRVEGTKKWDKLSEVNDLRMVRDC